MPSSSLPCSACHRTHPDDRCQQQVFGRQARMPFQVAIYYFANEYYATLPSSIMLLCPWVLCYFAIEHYATLPLSIMLLCPWVLCYFANEHYATLPMSIMLLCHRIYIPMFPWSCQPVSHHINWSNRHFSRDRPKEGDDYEKIVLIPLTANTPMEHASVNARMDVCRM